MWWIFSELTIKIQNGSLPIFISNNRQIWANWLFSIPPKDIRKTHGVLIISTAIKVNWFAQICLTIEGIFRIDSLKSLTVINFGRLNLFYKLQKESVESPLSIQLNHYYHWNVSVAIDYNPQLQFHLQVTN